MENSANQKKIKGKNQSKNILVPHWFSSEKPFLYKKNRQAKKKPIFASFSGFLQVTQKNEEQIKKSRKGMEKKFLSLSKLSFQEFNTTYKITKLDKNFEYIEKTEKNRNPLSKVVFKNSIERNPTNLPLQATDSAVKQPITLLSKLVKRKRADAFLTNPLFLIKLRKENSERINNLPPSEKLTAGCFDSEHLSIQSNSSLKVFCW